MKLSPHYGSWLNPRWTLYSTSDKHFLENFPFELMYFFAKKKTNVLIVENETSNSRFRLESLSNALLCAYLQKAIIWLALLVRDFISKLNEICIWIGLGQAEWDTFCALKIEIIGTEIVVISLELREIRHSSNEWKKLLVLLR